MSKTVDEKVVEMKFNNQNFEKNVNQSMNSISKLKSTLDFKGTESKAANSMAKIASSANNINLNGLSKAIDTINYRFSTIGVVATNIINQITNSITGKLTGAFNSVFGQIKSGGLSRAMNLEKANFQMANLLKDEKEVEAVMQNVKDAVDGTAYGLDAAAVVASQLTASGAKAGTELYNQLRSIAGVAAMTSSSYQEIGDIYTTIAGQGKLMSMQLMQLASRGLNVAAIMSKQMNITEAEFRDKVTKGQITYQQFADSMVKEFGEAAGKANETFDGALSNAKSALSRIGAKFYEPALNEARDVLNEVRLAINGISKALDPVINVMNGTLHNASKRIQDILKNITNDITNMSENSALVRFINTATRTITDFLVTFETLFDHVINIVFSIGDIFESLFENFEKARTSLKNTNDELKPFSDIFRVISEILKDVSEWLNKMESEGNKVSRTFSGIISIFKIVGGIIVSVLSGLRTVLQEVGILGGSILDITANIGDKISALYEKMRDTKAFDKITNGVIVIGRFIVSVVRAIGSALTKISSIGYKIFSSFGSGISSIFKVFFDASSNGAVGIINKLTEVINKFTDTISKDDSIFAKIEARLSLLFKNLIEGGKRVSEMLSKAISWIKNTLGNLLKSDFIGSLTSNVLKAGSAIGLLSIPITKIGMAIAKIKNTASFGKTLTNFVDNMSKALESIPQIGENFSNVLDQLRRTLKAYQNDLQADVLKKIATAVALLAGSLYVVSTIPVGDLIKAGVAITFITGALLGATKLLTKITQVKADPIDWKKNGFLNGLKEAIFQFKDLGMYAIKIGAIGTLIVKLAAAVFIIAKAMKDVAEIVKDDPLVALGSIMILIGSIYALVGAVLALDKFGSKNISRLRAIGGLMLAISASVLLMAEAYKTIGNSIKGLDSNQIMYTTLIFFGSIAAMVLSILVLDTVIGTEGSAKMLAIAAVVLSMATAILIMGVALALIATVVNNSGWENTLIAAGIMIGMLIVLVGLVAVLGAIGTAFSPLVLLAVAGVLLTVAAVLLALSVAISVFSVALGVIITEIGVLTALLSSENCGAAWAALGYLATLLITLAVGLTAMTFGIIGVGVLLLLTEALKTLIPLLIALAALPSEDIWSGIGKIAQALLGFILVGMMATLLSPVLLTLSAVLTAVGISMTIASAAMYMFVSAFTGLSALTQVSSELIVSGMSKIADAIHNLVMNILDHVDEFIGKLHDTIVGSAPKIKEMIKSLIDIASSAINEHLPTILDAIKQAINIIAEKLHLEGVVQFISSLAQVFNTFFGYIASMLQPVIDAGQNTTGSYIEGLTGMMDKLANAAIDIYVAFCTSLANALETRGDEVREAGRRLTKAVLNAMTYPDGDGESVADKAGKIATNVLDGFIGVLTAGRINSAAAAGAAIGKAAIDGMASKQGVDSNSPSKKAFKIGTYVIQGLVNALKKTDAVYYAAAGVGDGITSRIQESLSILEDYVNGEYVIEPVISPVLDMNGGLATASEISNMLSGTTSMSIAASINAQINKNQNENPYGDITKAIGTLHDDLQGLEANNYTVNGLTYDDSSSVAVAVTDLIRATKVGRRM